jgi:hypothetical protein
MDALQISTDNVFQWYLLHLQHHLQHHHHQHHQHQFVHKIVRTALILIHALNVNLNILLLVVSARYNAQALNTLTKIINAKVVIVHA